MKLHDLAPAQGSVKESKRIGRGAASGQGKTAGKGHKGQKARSGGGVRPGFAYIVPSSTILIAPCIAIIYKCFYTYNCKR